MTQTFYCISIHVIGFIITFKMAKINLLLAFITFRVATHLLPFIKHLKVKQFHFIFENQLSEVELALKEGTQTYWYTLPGWLCLKWLIIVSGTL